ncbi:MAG: electron transfer flavoprotein subunit beta/FixA family protein [Actinomycetaceae bacterium]|nr:electron transfer flavoprotein subunit beta/FixA family protein [Actinomycetaceae bacterium]
MKIVVCVKHVPDAESERRLEKGAIVRGEDDVLNELDENAIEAGVQIVEEMGGEVIALTMGPEGAEETVMRALQLGADRGIIISDESLAGSDALGTAQVLAAAINAVGQVDLVLTGMASLDGMTSMLPGALATRLSLPCLTLAKSLQVLGDRVRVVRAADGFEDVLEVPLPALVSVTDQVNDPRFPNFADMAAAKNKSISRWTLKDIDAEHVVRSGSSGAGVQVLRARQTPARTAGKIITDAGEGGVKLAEFLRQFKEGNQ